MPSSTLRRPQPSSRATKSPSPPPSPTTSYLRRRDEAQSPAMMRQGMVSPVQEGRSRDTGGDIKQTGGRGLRGLFSKKSHTTMSVGNTGKAGHDGMGMMGIARNSHDAAGIGFEGTSRGGNTQTRGRMSSTFLGGRHRKSVEAGDGHRTLRMMEQTGSGTIKADDIHGTIKPRSPVKASPVKAEGYIPPPPNVQGTTKGKSARQSAPSGTIRNNSGDSVQFPVFSSTESESEQAVPSEPSEGKRKKKNSLSLFLNAAKGKATISASNEKVKTSKGAAVRETLGRSGTVKAAPPLPPGTVRGLSHAAGQVSIQSLASGSKPISSLGPLPSSQPAQATVTMKRPASGTMRRSIGVESAKAAQRPESMPVGPGGDVATKSKVFAKPAMATRSSSSTVDAGSRPGSRMQSTPARSRAMSPATTIDTADTASEMASHFMLRMAVTYLTKTIMPELRSARQTAKSSGGQESDDHARRRKDLIERLRALERMDRAWGIDWMLKGKEGFLVSSKTREKERDALRSAVADWLLMSFLVERTFGRDPGLTRPSLERISRMCEAESLPLDGGYEIGNLGDIHGTGICTVAAVIVALARHAGPASKNSGSGSDEADEANASRAPSREVSPERMSIEHTFNSTSQTRSASVLSNRSDATSTGRKPSAQIHGLQPLKDEPVGGHSFRIPPARIRMPYSHTTPHDTGHSRLDTVLSMTPDDAPLDTSSPAAGAGFPFFASEPPETPISPQTILKPGLAESSAQPGGLPAATNAPPMRYHVRDPTPSLISGSTNRSSMALSDPPERGPRSISFMSVTSEEEARIRLKNSLGRSSSGFGDMHAREGSGGSSQRMRIEPDSIRSTPSRIRPRVRRGITMDPSSPGGSEDRAGQPQTRRTSDSSGSRPNFAPRRHTTQNGRTFVLRRSDSPSISETASQGTAAKPVRRQSSTLSQPYSPPMTPRRSMSPNGFDSPQMPSSRRTSFNSMMSSAPARESLKPLVIVKDGRGRQHSYQLGNCIGKGQFGVVYRALNLSTGQFVAIKRIQLDSLDEDLDQIMREVELMKRLKHPSIVRYLGMAKDDSFLDIILEYVEGGSLANAVRSFGKFSEHLVACYAAKILEGLHYLHGQDVVHCDLKAANILTTKKADVRLSDFGVSLNLRAVENQKDDSVVGTPNWVAPEIISLQGASPASDIWSLGCTVVELLEGKPPWAELDSNMAVLFKIVEEEWPIPEHYSEPLKDFLRLCFKKSPSERPVAETLFDHEWIRNEMGLDPHLRDQDSIPFLRRISSDAVRMHQLRHNARPSQQTDGSSSVEDSFRAWAISRQRPVLASSTYADSQTDLRSIDTELSTSPPSTDEAQPLETIAAERQRALDKLSSGDARRSPVQLNKKTSSAALARVKEKENRRGSDTTESTMKARSAAETAPHTPVPTSPSPAPTPASYARSKQAYETLAARRADNASIATQAAVPSGGMPPPPPQETIHGHSGSSPSRYPQQHHGKKDSKTDCVIQ